MAAKKTMAKNNKKTTTKVDKKALIQKGAAGSDEQPTDLNKSAGDQSAIDNQPGDESEATEPNDSTTTDIESGEQADQGNLPDAPIDQATPAQSNKNLAPAGKIDKFTAECQKVAKRYAESYPTCGAFHFCSDMQVFLENDLVEARSHQASLGKGQITTIKIQ